MMERPILRSPLRGLPRQQTTIGGGFIVPTLTCSNCSTPFHAKPSRVKRGQRFCSSACSGAAHTQPALGRFMRYVSFHSDGCWLWMGALDKESYPVFMDEAKRYCRAYRWAFQHYKGAIPAGHHVDHLCLVRRCVNPDHLDAVTPQENLRRMHEQRRARK